MAQMNTSYPAYSVALIEDPPPETAPLAAAAKFRRWLCGTLLLTLIFSVVFVFMNVKRDLEGLHGNKNVRVHALSRFSTYLMMYRFIPSQFDGLVLGNSVGLGYDTSQIHNYRVFNACMRDGSIKEGRILTEQMMRRGHLKIVILVLNPSLTTKQLTSSAYMTPHDYIASFGSLQTLMIDFQIFRERIGRPGPLTWDAFGRTLWQLKTDPNPFFGYSADHFALNPEGMAEMQELLGELHRNHVKVYIVFSPTYQPIAETYRDLMTTWKSQIMAKLSTDDVVIPFPADVEKSLEAKRENFPDYVHLTPSANATVMAVIAERIDNKPTR